MTHTPTIINGCIFWAPPDDLSLRLAAEAAPALQFPVLVPIDLTDSHGIDITAARLQEMATAYDPAVEMASLNFDHAWGGPSFGWCEKLWVQDGALWVRYGDLAPEAVDGVRSRRFTRRSAEIALDHPVTKGWYFTGCALLGNARPAVPGLPPVTLCRPQYVLNSKENPMPQPPVPPETQADPSPAPDAVAGAAELAALRAQVAAGDAALSTILRQRAELSVDQRLTALGNRVTPAVANLARPLLVELLAVKNPTTVMLQDDPAKAAAPVGIADRILAMLAACPPVEALGAGELAADRGLVTQPTSSLSAERVAELAAKYGFQQHSFGYRNN